MPLRLHGSLVSTQWLADHLDDPDLVILDGSFKLPGITPVAAEDFKKLLTRHGLNLIAERVEDEKTVVQLLDYAVDYAQGYLFGEPRAVREETLQKVSALETAPVIPFRKAG